MGNEKSGPLMKNTTGNAVKDAAADIVNQAAAPFQNLSKPDASILSKASGVVGAATSLTSLPGKFVEDAFARATNGIAKALPSFPAATMYMPVLGIPHTHIHPPAMPIPLPAFGPILTGCMSVLINKIPAARCGDYGIGPTCGAITPVFEIMTGSSKVFIGGQRAARMLDITLQCAPGPPPAAAAASKMSKVMSVAQKVMTVAPMVLGAATAIEKVVDTHGKANKAEAAAETASQDEKVAAAGEAASAAGEASAAILAAAMMGADLAMSAMAMAMGALMGKDPGAPPCVGAIVFGVPNVLIGGFPMPSWSTIAKGLKKLGKALARGRRGGKAKGKLFCLGCM